MFSSELGRVVGRIEPGPGDDLNLAAELLDKQQLNVEMHDSAIGKKVIEAVIAAPVLKVLQAAKVLRKASNRIR